jgi:hypothetical protein
VQGFLLSIRRLSEREIRPALRVLPFVKRWMDMKSLGSLVGMELSRRGSGDLTEGLLVRVVVDESTLFDEDSPAPRRSPDALKHLSVDTVVTGGRTPSPSTTTVRPSVRTGSDAVDSGGVEGWGTGTQLRDEVQRALLEMVVRGLTAGESRETMRCVSQATIVVASPLL